MRLSLSLLVLVGVGASAFAGCASDSTPDAPTSLALSPVVWNSAGSDVGTVQAVAEQDSAVFVFGSKGVQTFTSGSLVGSDQSITVWKSAAIVPSADALSTWTIGVDDAGHVQRVRETGAPQDVSDRYGVAADKVQNLVAGDARVAFLLDSGLAVSDGAKVTRYHVPAHAIAATAHVVALADTTAVRIFDQGKESDVALADAQYVAYDSAGSLMAATSHALYRVSDGSAERVYDAGQRTIHQLAGAGKNVWLAVDGDLGVWKDGHVAVASGGTLAMDARLVGSPSGDVWVISGGQLLRWSATIAPAGDEATWNATVQPIYAAVCSNCHSAPGTDKYSSNVDLSTYALWSARRAAVFARVVTKKGTAVQMPPPGSGFVVTDAQRSAIEAWSKP